MTTNSWFSRTLFLLLTSLIPLSLLQNLCPPLSRNSNGIKLECRNLFRFVDCSTPAAPGTTAYYSCMDNFVSSDWKNQVYTMICLHNGLWFEDNYSFKNHRCNFVTPENGNGVCGKIRRSIQPLILGGETTKAEYWPWHASIFHSFTLQCGGTLISPNVVITAAHCVVEDGTTNQVLPLTDFRVKLGASSSNYNDPGENSQDFKVEQVIVHPNYNPNAAFSSDLALIVLNLNNQASNAFFIPVCLPSVRTVVFQTGIVGEVVGFGSTSVQRVPSKDLRHVALPVVPPKLCSVGLDEKSSASSFCAGFNTQPAKAVCYGDSGSGFVVIDSALDGDGDQRYKIEGIVSTTQSVKPCQSYARFTKVRFFMRWILANLNGVYAPSSAVASPNAPPARNFADSATPQKSPTVQGTLQTLAISLLNRYRGFHGAAPLKLNSNLNIEAQSWAETLISTNKFYVKSDDNYIQTLYEFSITGGSKSPAEVMEMAVESWYATRSSYNPASPIPSSYPFSQLVWKATTDVGVGLSTRNGRTVVVVCYSPKGNVFLIGGDDATKYFRQNVQV